MPSAVERSGNGRRQDSQDPEGPVARQPERRFQHFHVLGRAELNLECHLLHAPGRGLATGHISFNQTYSSYAQQTALLQQGWPQFGNVIVQDRGKQPITVR